MATMASALAGLAAGSAVAAPPSVPAVLELFTSQGCSSCPPADALMKELTQEKNIVALSLPVDYWDYLGWKDTLASPANTQRQRAYARVRGDRSIYTPQTVVNGLTHVAGNNSRAVRAAIAQTRAQIEKIGVPVSIAANGTRLDVNVAEAAADSTVRKGTLWLVLFSKDEEVQIKRGENAGRSITYHNVVREMTPVGMWDGKAMQLQLPRNDVMGKGYDGCAVLLQAGSAGPIIGAAMLPGW